MKEVILGFIRRIYAWYSEDLVLDLDSHRGDELAGFVCKSLSEQTKQWSMKGGAFIHTGGAAILVKHRQVLLINRDSYLNDGALSVLRQFEGHDACRIREHLDRWIAKSLFFPNG
jgi:hypothetical protein